MNLRMNSPLNNVYIAAGSTETPQLSTHLNYLNYLWRNTRQLTATYSNRVERNPNITRVVFSERLNLARLTYRSLQEEMEQVNAAHDYARVCSAWVAIKGYYLLFYLETVLYSLVAADPAQLKVSHDMTRKFVRDICKSSALNTSFASLTDVVTHADCVSTGVTAGANLRGQLDDQSRHKQLMKKLKEYAKEEFKRRKSIERLAGAAAQAFNQQELCLMDFFYWYRIKSNYRDLEFIAGESSSTPDLFDFYRMYNETAIGVAGAYIEVINDLFQRRSGEKDVLISF